MNGKCNTEDNVRNLATACDFFKPVSCENSERQEKENGVGTVLLDVKELQIKTHETFPLTLLVYFSLFYNHLTKYREHPL